jgi:beta-glucosidase
LLGGQNALIDAVAETKTPFVLALVNSKPLVLPASARQARAVLECFNPGMLGGRAFAEILFGDVCPSGKLPLSFPRHAGQIPIFYNQLRTRHGGYVDLPLEPAYGFGHGLSYTRFSYSNLVLDAVALEPGHDVEFEVDVRNEGEREGVEIVQAYLHDVVTSVTWPNLMLAAFARVRLAAGEVRRLRLKIPAERLSLVDARGRRTVEPGEFELRVGPSSRDVDHLTARFEVAGVAFSFERLPGIARSVRAAPDTTQR